MNPDCPYCGCEDGLNVAHEPCVNEQIKQIIDHHIDNYHKKEDRIEELEEREKKLRDALDDIDRYLFMRGPMRDKNHWVKAKKGYNKYIHNITRKSLGYKEEK